MDINFDSVILKNSCMVFEDTINNDCKTDIDSNTISKILGISVKAINSTGEIKDNKIEYKSNLVYSICYVDSENNIKRYECVSEVAGTINGVDNKSGYVKICLINQKVEGDVSSLKLILKSIFKVKASVIDGVKTDYVTNTDGLILKNCDVDYYKSFGKRTSSYPIEEEFSVDYAIKNVLSHKITPIITAVQCGVGCIIVDGEVYISAILLQNDEKSNIIREQKIIPFRAEIEYEEAMPSMIAIAEVCEKSFKTDISVDEDGKKSVIKANIILGLEGEAFANSTIICSADCFSLSRELDLDFSVCEALKPLEQKNEKVNISSDTQKIDLIENSTLLSTYYERVEIAETKVINGKLNIMGVVFFTAIFSGEDGSIFSRKLETDFSSDISVSDKENICYSVVASILSLNCKLMENGTISCEYEISFQINGFESQKIKILTGVKDTGDKRVNTSSISVYIPLENEELWSLSKRLNIKPEEICEVNKDLQFPLSGNERIVVYRQKR